MFIYFENDKYNISKEEISKFIKKVDNFLLDPIHKRKYFQSYEILAAKFYSIGNLIYCRNNNNTLVGLVVFYADTEEYVFAYETFIGVLNDFNGLGIAKELISREIKLAKKIGMKGIMTNCHKKNKIKIHLNKKLGFKEIRDIKEIHYFLKMNPKWNGKVFFKMVFE